MTDEGEDEDEVPAKKRKVSKATPKKTPKPQNPKTPCSDLYCFDVN